MLQIIRVIRLERLSILISTELGHFQGRALSSRHTGKDTLANYATATMIMRKFKRKKHKQDLSCLVEGTALRLCFASSNFTKGVLSNLLCVLIFFLLQNVIALM